MILADLRVLIGRKADGHVDGSPNKRFLDIILPQQRCHHRNSSHMISDSIFGWGNQSPVSSR